MSSRCAYANYPVIMSNMRYFLVNSIQIGVKYKIYHDAILEADA